MLVEMPERRRNRHCLLRASFTTGLVLTVCGCGSSERLDTARVERAIAESILTEHHLYTLVKCPAGEPQQAGVRFRCMALLTVGSYPVYATETDGDGHVSYRNDAPLRTLDTTRVQSAIVASLRGQRHRRVQVSCPSGVLQQRGLSFTCTAHVDGANSAFGVVEMDGEGHVRYVER